MNLASGNAFINQIDKKKQYQEIMKKYNLSLRAFIAIIAIILSSCGASSSSNSASTEKVEGITSTDKVGGNTSTDKVEGSASTEKVEGSDERTESGHEVTIGDQVWTSKNLDVSTYRNGDIIPEVKDWLEWAELKTGAWCYYNNDASNGAKYGKLYNWYAVNDPRGLAPKGYHIPTKAEWEKLFDYLGGFMEAGTKMKNISGWYSGYGSYNKGNGTNSSGFSGLAGGRRIKYSFDRIDYLGEFWSSTVINESNAYDLANPKAWGEALSYSAGHVAPVAFERREGRSVRCIKD